MKKQKSSKIDLANIRLKAEELLKQKHEISDKEISEDDALKYLHELEVHQVELELINQELQTALKASEEASYS